MYCVADVPLSSLVLTGIIARKLDLASLRSPSLYLRLSRLGYHSLVRRRIEMDVCRMGSNVLRVTGECCYFF